MNHGSRNGNEETIMCLCYKCRRDYIAAGYGVRKTQVYQIETDICTKCNFRNGFDYYIQSCSSDFSSLLKDRSVAK